MDSNRVRVSLIREATLGVLPNTPKMRVPRIIGESLRYTPRFFTPNELRADRMNVDPTQINQEASGGLNFEFSYPEDPGAFSDILRSAMFNDWVRTPQHDNDEVADSAITLVDSASSTFTVVDQSGLGGFAGTSYKAGHLVRASGFGESVNNVVTKVTSSTATTVVVEAALEDEAAPPGTARLKVVGFEGAAGDVTATASGLASTALDFTTLGLAKGQWIKVGGSAAATKFDTTSNNGWARISGDITVNAIPLDNLPAGWAVDSGSGKTIRVFFGDYIRNGTTRTSLSIEKSFLSQAQPTHIIHKGMVVNRFSKSSATDQAISGTVEFMGLTGAQDTVAYGNTYSPADSTLPVLTGNVNVGSISEAGAGISSPNWARRLDINLVNNVRMIGALGNIGAVELGVGEAQLTGTLETYFGSNTYLAKLLAGTVSNLSSRTQSTRAAGSAGHAVIDTIPRVTFTDGSPNASGKNQDVILPLSWSASIDEATNCLYQIDRVEYFEM